MKEETIKIGKDGFKEVLFEDVMQAIGWASQEQMALILSHLSFCARTDIIVKMKFSQQLRDEFKLAANDFQSYVFGFISDDEFENLPEEEYDKFQSDSYNYRKQFYQNVIKE